MTVKQEQIKDDLYEAVNGEWIKTAKIPADKPATGGFNDLVDEIDQLMMNDFDEFVEKKSATGALGQAVKLYQLAADFNRREQEGATPLKPLLSQIESLASFADYQKNWANFILSGLPSPISFDVDADMKNATMNALFAGAPGLILPDKTYYEADNPQKEPLLQVYRSMMEKLLQGVGYDAIEATEIIDQAVAFDALLVPNVKSAEESADYSKMYNPQTLVEFKAHTQTLDLGVVVKEIIGADPEKIIVMEPKYFEAISEILTASHFNEFKGWLLAKTVSGLAGYLTDELRGISGEYSRTLSGSQEPMKQRKYAYYLAKGEFDQVVGDYYGRKYFGETAKNDVHQMVEKMISVYQSRLTNNTWLSPATREKAVLKLSKLGIQVGYPDKVDSLYDRLFVDETKPLLTNLLAFTKIETADVFSRWNQTVERDRWEMSAATVNAYYHPFKNIIVFPAAILQAPFYSLKQSSSENYGGIGAVIAHEISHAFDNNGSLFDEYGNLNNWWTKEDSDQFKNKAQQMIDQFDGIEFAGQKVNGKLTVSENIADAGGLSCALEAAKAEADVDIAAFFVNWTTIWRMKATEQYMQLLLSVDVHAPAKLRANVQVKNLDDFYATFNVKSGDAMFLDEDQRVKIW